MQSLTSRIKKIILKEQAVDEKGLNKALEEQKKSGGDLRKILVSLKLLSEKESLSILSKALDIPLMDVSRLKVEPDIIEIIPKEIALKYQVLPVSKMGECLTVAMADPLNVFAKDNICAVTGMKISPIISNPKDIEFAIGRHYAAEENNETFEEIMQDIKESEDVELVKDSAGQVEKDAVESLTDEAPIIKLSNAIIQQAVLSKASDVFIEPLEDGLRVRYRVDGVIREVDRMAKVLHFPIVSRIKVISNLDISEHRLPQDGRFRSIFAKKEVDFRVSILPTAMGEKVVLRVLDKTAAMLDIEKLGFEEKSLVRLQDCAHRPHGMILLCGPTGSGKTTTLYSILKYIDSPEKNIVTVEDPVEYQVKGINQVNIQAGHNLTFASSLRSILRQDPDVIMIGEIRDSETIDIAVKAALTGHLVLSSLHTNSACGSIIRMVNMGIEPFLLCSSVVSIVAQRLLRKVCDHCKESYDVPDEVVKKYGISKFASGKKVSLFRAKGCGECYDLGYRGRIGITEILVFSQKLKEMILQGASEVEVKQIGREEGMLTLREDALRKACEGLTTLEEVLRITAPDEVL